MKNLNKIIGKKKKIIVGLMSGTSADGIDTVIIDVRRHGISTAFRQIAFSTYPYPDGFKKLLMEISDVKSARLDTISRCNILIGTLFGEAVRKIVRKAGLRMDDVDLVGSHGQTICHLPVPVPLFGKNIRSTLQIGHPGVIAKTTGIPTIGDFRIADIAVGGSGAPLVPLFDYIMFRSQRKNRILLNIGGIANLTSLPRACSTKSILAFDTGPGNMIVDYLMMRFFKKRYDNDGKTAASGKIVPPFLSWLMNHPYLEQKPPKSTGREMFGKEFAEKIIRRAGNIRKIDIITTVSEFTAISVYDAYRRFIRSKMIPDELFVSGGGAHNNYIMEALRRYFPEVRISVTDEKNISADAKEAICFAILANETLHAAPGNIVGATGASRETILGTICLP
jgi:anhydro-N-acetylmuramic acid kinase